MQLCHNSKGRSNTICTTGPFPVCDSWELTYFLFLCQVSHLQQLTLPGCYRASVQLLFLFPFCIIDIPRPFLTHKSTYRLWSRKTTSCQNKQTHKHGKFLIKISKSLINELLNFRGSDRLTILLRSATLTPSALMPSLRRLTNELLIYLYQSKEIKQKQKLERQNSKLFIFKYHTPSNIYAK